MITDLLVARIVTYFGAALVLSYGIYMVFALYRMGKDHKTQMKEFDRILNDLSESKGRIDEQAATARGILGSLQRRHLELRKIDDNTQALMGYPIQIRETSIGKRFRVVQEGKPETACEDIEEVMIECIKRVMEIDASEAEKP